MHKGENIPCNMKISVSDVHWCTAHVSSNVQCMSSVVQRLYSVCQSGTGVFGNVSSF